MKLNRIIAVVAVCASAAASFSIAGAQVPGMQESIVSSGRAARIVADILDPASGKVFVTAHRGDWRNYPENSLPAIESVIRMGVDVVELDVRMTKDSVLVLCHDKRVDRTTDGRGRVRNFTLDSLRKLRLKSLNGISPDSLGIPTLREALECCKDRIVVNLDHGYRYYDQVLALTEELGVTGQVLIKGRRPLEEVSATMSGYRHNMMYMPVINIQKHSGKVLFAEYIGSEEVPPAYEVCFRKWDGSLPDCFRKIRASGSRIWVNTLWPSLCGGRGHDDEAAFRSGNPDKVYGRYISLGVTIIQTDRPEMLLEYLRSRGLHD
ncbi:MAG: glycerophosphodiester phosphodiesterase family protein [Candidatus Cryptobacteroides sp.]